MRFIVLGLPTIECFFLVECFFFWSSPSSNTQAARIKFYIKEGIKEGWGQIRKTLTPCPYRAISQIRTIARAKPTKPNMLLALVQQGFLWAGLPSHRSSRTHLTGPWCPSFSSVCFMFEYQFYATLIQPVSRLAFGARSSGSSAGAEGLGSHTTSVWWSSGPAQTPACGQAEPLPASQGR